MATLHSKCRWLFKDAVQGVIIVRGLRNDVVTATGGKFGGKYKETPTTGLHPYESLGVPSVLCISELQ